MPKLREEITLVWQKVWRITIFALAISLPSVWMEHKYHTKAPGWILFAITIPVYVFWRELKALAKRIRKKGV